MTKSEGFHHHSEPVVPVLVSLAAAAVVGFAWFAVMFVIITYGRF